MERRIMPDRRTVHMFVALDRRTGPYDRRGVSARLRERAQEMEKIRRLQSFKEKDRIDAPAASWMNKMRIVYLTLIVLILLVALFRLK
jgi:hypothetical protein